MPLQVGNGYFPAAISDSRINRIARSDTPPEMSVWEKIKTFFCSTHKSEALECIRNICHPAVGTTREDVAGRFEQLRTFAYSGFSESIQSGRHGKNHFCILDESSREMLSVTLDDAGNYVVKCQGHNATHSLSMNTERGEEYTEHIEGEFGTLRATHATATTEPQTAEDYEAIWSVWKKAAPRGESNGRAEAVCRMRDCLNSDNPKLDLSYVYFTSLPDYLPPNITELNMVGLITIEGGLTSLPALPSGLKVLQITGNKRLIHLPALPSGLEVLNVSGNQLTHLTEPLPSGLRVLNVGGNQLTHLTEPLPPGLKVLTASYNQLSHLPEPLPPGLQTLRVTNNQLTSLPELPSGLRELSATHNRLTSLPESIARLPSYARVNLEGNTFSAHTLQALRDMPPGLRIHFSMAGPSVPREARALHLAVADWLTPAQEGEPAPADRWQAFGRENDAASFSRFLDRLNKTENFKKDSGFKVQIASWLTQLAEDNALRTKTFAMATEATSSCEDRVTLALNQMKTVQLVHNAEKGEYDNHLPALVSVGREMFRLGELELIAREKVKKLYFVDEIEVYLGYQNKLKEPLGLTSVTTEMRFFGVSHITESDLQVAEIQVKTAENSQFREWILHWEPLHRVLERTYPESWKALSEKKILDYDDSYRTLSDTELKPAGLVGNTDAERTIGARAMDSAEKAFLDVLRPLVNRMLGGKLNARWLD